MIGIIVMEDTPLMQIIKQQMVINKKIIFLFFKYSKLIFTLFGLFLKQTDTKIHIQIIIMDIEVGN